MRRKVILVSILVIVVATISLAVFFLDTKGLFLKTTKNTENSDISLRDSAKKYKTLPIYIGKEKFVAEIADTDELREIGLSGRAALTDRGAMLFVFSRPGYYPFWMKDMNFSIDMLWLDEDGIVLSIFSDISPSTYPKTFVSDKKARYVLELPALTATNQKIKIGDVLIFDKNTLKNSSN